MAKSEARKKRQQAVRGGKADPAISRLDWNGINPVTRTTPTREAKLRKQFHKHKGKWNPSRYSEDSIFIDFIAFISAIDKFYKTSTEETCLAPRSASAVSSWLHA
ncbi:hypothetical protein [Paenibacillus sp. GCM10027626]|uniref:hypothetical protein n=1 Tax=Paenibacillus sp. GCM10027626 TaxID=3273411 RepID=UPI0036338527